MTKSSTKQSSKSKGSGNKTSSGGKGSSSTVPVNRSWQDPTQQPSQTVARGSATSLPVGRWLTEPSWQEPFNNIAEVPAAESASGNSGAAQGSGAAGTYATSRR